MANIWQQTTKIISVKPTNIQDPEYFHKVVDCQYACPAHTPVPEYIRLIAAEKYTEPEVSINFEATGVIIQESTK